MRTGILILLFLILLTPAMGQDIKIAALRVQFIEDNNSLTTGNGLFMIDTVTTDPYAIDPAPHDRTYFKDQLIAAANYFNNVSNGRVHISGDVFPRRLNDVYQLPQQMSYYNTNATTADVDKGLAQLFLDAVNVADQDENIDFSKYDLIVIFHAGVGRDIDVGFDETPQDIPSLYVTPQFVQKNLDPEFTGISVDNGNAVVENAIIMPETENQVGLQIGMTGLLVSNIGSYLGLYDLFSSTDQTSGVGRFGLMDVGLLNSNGLVPSPPSAFSRYLLGWETPLELSSDQKSVTLSRLYSTTSAAPSLVKIPINEDEYYLLEYRGDLDNNIDSVYYDIANETNEFPSYLKVLKTKFPNNITVSDSSGVLLSVDNYDWGIPGAGMLIWHIDESVIRNSGGGINDDPDNRAVDLEEADGSQDLGQSYNELQAGYSSELGYILDFWYKGNEAPLYKNEFSLTSTPSTIANRNRAETGITISNFNSAGGETMTFDFSRSFYKNGFPVKQGQNERAFLSSISARPAGHSADFVFSIDPLGDVYAVGASGQGLFGAKNLVAQTQSCNKGTSSIALADADGDGLDDLLFAALCDSLYSFDLSTPNADSLASRAFPAVSLGETVSAPLVVAGNHLFAAAGSKIYSYDFSGNILATVTETQFVKDFQVQNDQPLVADQMYDYSVLVHTSASQTALITATLNESSTNFNVFDISSGNKISSFSTGKLSGPFAVCDWDANGTYDVIYTTSKSIEARSTNGAWLLNFPFIPVLASGEELIGTPVIYSPAGDKNLVVAGTTNMGQLVAFNTGGKNVSGFPIAAGGDLSISAIINQMDTGGLELTTISNKGIVSSFPVPGTNENTTLIWGQANKDAANNALVLDTPVIQAVGTSLVPEERFFNYPNPNVGNSTTIRYYLNKDASVKLRLFDVSGYKVDEFDGPGQANTDNEIVWNVSDIASGVYVCQLEASTQGQSEKRMIKILVVH